MKAFTYESYGGPDVLVYSDTEIPLPGDGEVLIKVRASSVNPADWHFVRGEPYFARVIMGLRKPKERRVGIDVAGTVEAVGSDVTRFKPGDKVFGASRGTFAEYVCAPQTDVSLKPDNVTFEQAGTVGVAGHTALQAVRDHGHVKPGHKVLINGAAGGVGTFAVQIGKSFGADVTAVCSARNVEMVRSIGADKVVDYTNEDFTETDQQYDVIVDCMGRHQLSAITKIMTRNGIYVVVGAPTGRWIAPLPATIKTLVLSKFATQSVAMFIAKTRTQDLMTLGELMRSGKVKPVIDRSYPLPEVPAALRYLEEGHARGKVVITVA